MYEEVIWDESGQIIGYNPATPIEEAMVNLENTLEDTERILEQYIYPLFRNVLQIYE